MPQRRPYVRLALLTFSLSLILCHHASAQEKALHWAQFRGPAGLGVSGEKIPVTWEPQQNLLWKKELPGAGASTPILVGDRIYLTSYSGYSVPGRPMGDLQQLQRHLLCITRAEGGVVWEKILPARQPEQATIRENHGYASNSVAADGERVYAFFGASGVYAFDHNGKELWQADVGDGLNGWGTAASPILYEDLVIVNASVESSALIALDRKTGKEKWRAGGIKESWNTPILVPVAGKGTELVVAIMGSVLGFDPGSGKKLWSCKTDIPWYMVPSLVAHEGVVYCVGGRNPGGALAVRCGGSGEVTATHRLWFTKTGTNVPSPVYHDGHLYWMHDVLGIAYCADAKTGKLLYEQRIPQANGVYASAVLADGRIYYTSRAGKTFVVAASPKFELLATNNLKDGSTFNASPAIAGGRLYLRSDRYLYCIGEKN